jgi:hypothetical protein
MDPVAMGSILSMLAAAVWAVWTWTADREKERQLQRDQAAALYVNPYILALAQLNARLRGMLDGDDLAQAKREDPGPHEGASRFAIEFLYVAGMCFGWATATLRYGPYTRDRVALDCYARIARTFDARAEFADEAFRLTLPEQVALGQAVMRRVATSVGSDSGHSRAGFAHPEFVTVTLHEFQKDFRSAQSEAAELYRSPSIRRVVDAIDGTGKRERLPGRERLAAVRPLLTRLIRHLEHEEGIVLAPPEGALRSTGTTTVSAAAPEILYRTKGRIRLRVPRVKDDEAFASGLSAQIGKWTDVDEVTVNPATGCIDVKHHSTAPGVDFRARFQDAIAIASRPNGRPAAASRPRRAGSIPRRRASAAGFADRAGSSALHT